MGKCKGCLKEFEKVKPSDNLCPECKELISVGIGSNNIGEFEKLRAKFNSTRSHALSYGQFVQYVQNVYQRSRCR
jgi:hypothetical protein